MNLQAMLQALESYYTDDLTRMKGWEREHYTAADIREMEKKLRSVQRMQREIG